uniref:Uncharacterized protein n=1 Tax=Eptatretus burgeri TaxID=7764 RepID=A0A8C4NM42_EPTBU
MEEAVYSSVKAHHKLAFEFISKALRLDESGTGPVEDVVIHYMKGIEELEKGIKIPVTGEGIGCEHDRSVEQ